MNSSIPSICLEQDAGKMNGSMFDKVQRQKRRRQHVVSFITINKETSSSQ